MDAYGFSEINRLRREANIAFYKDVIEIYFNLSIQKFDTCEMRACLINILNLYRRNNSIEKATVKKLRIKYGKDFECIQEVEEALQKINNYYEKVYNYFQRLFLVFDAVIETQEPRRFVLPKEELSYDFYFGIQKTLTE